MLMLWTRSILSLHIFENSRKFIVTIPVRKPLMEGIFVKAG